MSKWRDNYCKLSFDAYGDFARFDNKELSQSSYENVKINTCLLKRGARAIEEHIFTDTHTA